MCIHVVDCLHCNRIFRIYSGIYLDKRQKVADSHSGWQMFHVQLYLRSYQKLFCVLLPLLHLQHQSQQPQLPITLLHQLLGTPFLPPLSVSASRSLTHSLSVRLSLWQKCMFRSQRRKQHRGQTRVALNVIKNYSPVNVGRDSGRRGLMSLILRLVDFKKCE